jgi:hypothetical protein
MAQAFDLDANFETEGLFFTPPPNSTEIPGRLIYGTDGLALERSPYTVGPEQLFVNEVEHADTILGVTREGDCALFDVYLAQPGPRTFLAGGQLLTTARYCIGSCVIGVHIGSKTEPVVTSASFRFAGLESWLGSGISVAIDPARSKIPLPHSLKSDPIIARKITVLGASVSISYAFYARNTHSESIVTGLPVVSVRPDQPQPLNVVCRHCK